MRAHLIKIVVLSAFCIGLVGCQPDKSANKKAGSSSFKVKREPKNKVVYELTDDQTKHLWDLEHHGNILGKYGFSPLIKAIVSKSKEDLIGILGDTSATILVVDPRPVDDPDRSDDSETSLKYDSTALNLSRMQRGASNVKSLNVEQFAQWLVKIRNRFSDSPPPQARFDVKSLLPPRDDDYWSVTCVHRLWGNSVDGGPLEISLDMNLKTYEIEKTRLSLGNWLADCQINQIDVLESKFPLFEPVETKSTRISNEKFHDNWTNPLKVINTGGVYACDYNRDGITDMFVTDIAENAGKMFTGKKNGKFLDESFFLKLELAKNSRIATFVDIDNDGWEDVIFPDLPKIYKNLKGESFRNMTGMTNLPLMISLSGGTHERVSGVIPADYDLDGDLDLYITRSVENVGSWLESLQPGMADNQLLRNDGNWMFTDVTQRTGTDGDGRSTFSAVWTDINNDRYPDLYVINEFGNGTLMINQQGKGFKKQMLTPNQNDFGSMGINCGDYDNDGNVDIYVSNMYSKAGSRVMGNMVDGTYPAEIQDRLRNMVAGGELYKNNGNLGFQPVGKQFQVHAAGWAWGSSMADFNNDGWLDLYVTAGFMSRDREKPDG